MTQLNIDDHNNLSTADGRLIRRMVRDARTKTLLPGNTGALELGTAWRREKYLSISGRSGRNVQFGLDL